jgi:hypothetical protein
MTRREMEAFAERLQRDDRKVSVALKSKLEIYLR